MKCLLSPWMVISAVFTSLWPAGQAQAAADRPETLQSELIARIHFAGLQQVSADSNGAVFKEIWNLPVTAQFRNEALDKLAATFAGHFSPKSGATAGNCIGLIRPLLNDLCTAESYAEVRRPKGATECSLALKLDAARLEAWQSNWSQILAGWQWKDGTTVRHISVVATNSWFVLHCLSGQQGATGENHANTIMTRVKEGERPVSEAREHWLTAEVDLARLFELSTPNRGRDLPRMNLTVTGRRDYLRSQARLTFPKPVVTRIETWQVPTDLIRDPLISFTACQGLRSWLQRQPLIQELGLSTVPNQLYCWALSQTPFQIQTAAPVPNAGEAFARVQEHWVPQFNQSFAKYAVGHVQKLTNRTELIWRGLPVLVPYLEPATDHGRDYLHAGLFPVSPSTNPAPAALFEQLTTRTNLLYYDWEITQGRLDQLRPLLQLAGVFLTVSPMSTNSVAYKWLEAVQPRLGNAATEIEAASPRELNFTRTSHLGLTGLELLTLANWVQGTNFPRMSFDLAFRPVVKPRRQSENR